MILLQCLAREPISSDVWSLALGAAQAHAREMGIDDESGAFAVIAKSILRARKGGLMGLFVDSGFMS